MNQAEDARPNRDGVDQESRTEFLIREKGSEYIFMNSGTSHWKMDTK